MYDVVGRYISDRESRSLAGSPLQVQVSVKVPVGAAFLKGLHVGSDVHARYALIECPKYFGNQGGTAGLSLVPQQ